MLDTSCTNRGVYWRFGESDRPSRLYKRLPFTFCTSPSTHDHLHTFIFTALKVVEMMDTAGKFILDCLSWIYKQLVSACCGR